jgi:hypothetical protein
VHRLTEAQWSEVFRLRCKSKRGDGLTGEEQALAERAWKEDRKRYAAMDGDVFNATVPAGSSVRWRGRGRP